MGSEPTDTDVMSVFSSRIPSGYRLVKSRPITIPEGEGGYLPIHIDYSETKNWTPFDVEGSNHGLLRLA